MTQVHLVHGFNVSDGGRSTTDKLVVYVRQAGYVPVQHDYGWMFLLGTLFRNPTIAKQVAAQVRPGDIGIGHSNGCAILSRAAELGAPFHTLVFINPALDNDWTAPPHIKEVRVFHSREDAAVRIARLIPGVRWGDMGRVGYTGTDDRYHNFDMTPYSHSEVFDHLPKWAPFIVPRNVVDEAA